MVKKNDLVLEALKVLAWFVLIVLCFNSITALVMFIVNFIRSSSDQNNYDGLGLFNHIGRHSFSIGLMILKAILFFHLVKLFSKLNLVKPFSEEVAKLIAKISYDAFSIAIVSLVAHIFEKGMVIAGFSSGMINRYLDSTKSFLMMAAVLYVIARIFKKGIELQKENELTI